MWVFYEGAKRLASHPLHMLISSVARADEGTAFLRQSTNPSAASHVWADNLGEFLINLLLISRSRIERSSVRVPNFADDFIFYSGIHHYSFLLWLLLTFLGLLPEEILIADSAGEALCGLYSGGVTCGNGRGEERCEEDDGDKHADLRPWQLRGELAGHAADLGFDAGDAERQSDQQANKRADDGQGQRFDDNLRADYAASGTERAQHADFVGSFDDGQRKLVGEPGQADGDGDGEHRVGEHEQHVEHVEDVVAFCDAAADGGVRVGRGQMVDLAGELGPVDAGSGLEPDHAGLQFRLDCGRVRQRAELAVGDDDRKLR